MADKKDRVIAIDYFRGICILMVIVNHSYIFSKPFTYLGGAGGLWTSAAELFFMLSGITLMIVRGGKIKSDFNNVARKIWRRAVNIYTINLLVVTLSVVLALLLPMTISSNVIGPLPDTHGFSLLWQMATLQYSVGLASFLIFYSAYLLVAPFVLYASLTRLWPLVLLSSMAIYVLASSQVFSHTPYAYFAIWQFYFVLGIIIARFRVPIISWFYRLPERAIRRASILITATTALAIGVSVLLAFNIYPIVTQLVNDGWLPAKIRGAYLHLLNNENTINVLLRDNRMGLLRPLATTLFLLTGYLIYQKYKPMLLARTGNFVNTMGRETLWIFVAQAIVIPLMAALPIRHDNIAINFMMTSTLIYLMWVVAKRRVALAISKGYANLLSDSLARIKYAYLYRTEDNA